MDEKSNKSTIQSLFKEGDGLFLRGLIVSADVVEKEWEGSKYKQLKAMISNGRQSFLFSASDKRGPIPNIEIGRRAIVEAERVNQEKGVTTVYGRFNYES